MLIFAQARLFFSLRYSDMWNDTRKKSHANCHIVSHEFSHGDFSQFSNQQCDCHGDNFTCYMWQSHRIFFISKESQVKNMSLQFIHNHTDITCRWMTFFSIIYIFSVIIYLMVPEYIMFYTVWMIRVPDGLLVREHFNEISEDWNLTFFSYIPYFPVTIFLKTSSYHWITNQLKLGASIRWRSWSLYCSMRNSNTMAIGKTHPALVLLVLLNNKNLN